MKLQIKGKITHLISFSLQSFPLVLPEVMSCPETVIQCPWRIPRSLTAAIVLLYPRISDICNFVHNYSNANKNANNFANCAATKLKFGGHMQPIGRFHILKLQPCNSVTSCIKCLHFDLCHFGGHFCLSRQWTSLFEDNFLFYNY